MKVLTIAFICKDEKKKIIVCCSVLFRSVQFPPFVLVF